MVLTIYGSYSCSGFLGFFTCFLLSSVLRNSWLISLLLLSQCYRSRSDQGDNVTSTERERERSSVVSTRKTVAVVKV